MSEIQVGLLLIVAMVGFVLLGLQVAIALFSLSFAGIWLMRDDFALASRMLGLAAYSGVQEIIFSSIPLFVLMGMFVAYAGLGKDIFDVAAWVLRKIAGGLGIAVVAANAVFAAVTGISIASAAVFTRVAVPELLKHGYSPQLAVGTVAGSSILGMLIPPSVLFILFGILAEESIGKLFIAGLIPGLLMTAAFSLGIVVMVKRFPKFAGTVHGSADLEDTETWASALRKFAPVGVLVALMLGGLYSGVFTPTEAGAVGAMGALIIALLKRRLDAKTVWQVLRETGVIAVSILILLCAANLYSRMLAFSGVPEAISTALQGAGGGLFGFWVLYILVVVALGCILDSTSIMLIVVPICIPIAKAFGIDMIQFGVVTVIAVEIGLLTPPLGMSAFTVQSSLEDRSIGLDQIFRGCLPFVAIMAAVMLLCAAIPSLSLVLVR